MNCLGGDGEMDDQVQLLVRLLAEALGHLLGMWELEPVVPITQP